MSDFKLDLEKLIEKHLFSLPIGNYGPESGFPLHAFLYVIIKKILIHNKTLDNSDRLKLKNFQEQYLNIVDIKNLPNHHEIINFLNSIN